MDLREILTTTRIGQLAIKSVPILSPQDSVHHAAAQMRSHSHGSALVCDNDRLVGVFTERDLLRWLADGRSLDDAIAEAMTANPQTVTSDDALMSAIGYLDQGGYRRIPVVNADGAPIGIIDVKTIVHFFVEHFPSAIYNQSPQSKQTTSDREGA
ncbi:Arabinose 5-phosphate isomerase KdsD [Symmachiella macrocystis]|uniref:Arabinose 5-phosphate isomerase KdsD n=1 Tax=Symmachiella macrocystis TaxID=2527985 RepID=A0A5C6BPP0_9PLAN|nr:CBS domain-containing protein [Symmachiella macrocystis]TWU14038.1 Arabinose 5-phosphate isomerase KdsD [Symmachiella macrocystis]